VQTVRWQRQDAGKCSGANGDHHEQAHAKSVDGGGQDKGADAKAAPTCRINEADGSRATKLVLTSRVSSWV
jgi:hypothetical protein